MSDSDKMSTVKCNGQRTGSSDSGTLQDRGCLDRWLLPEGVDEVLPDQAESLEKLRRSLIDLMQSWGYRLVMPPLMEFLESLLTGAGHDLDLQTFKITDQLSGRMMGIRADMTPQIARIDAHRLKQSEPSRLCYLGSVLRTKHNGLSESRNPLQIGAELFGHAGLESDVEIISLMLSVLEQSGVKPIFVDIGHIGIFRGLIQQSGLNGAQEHQLFDILQRKAVPELEESIGQWYLPADIAAMWLAMPELNGDRTILAEAGKALKKANEQVQKALSDLTEIIKQLDERVNNMQLNIDLAELRGFHYHTGVMFAAYTQGRGQALARGGRYDEIGQVFGRARPATGFSTDLMALIQCSHCHTKSSDDDEYAVICPWSNDPDLIQAVAELRAKGVRVINELPGHDTDPDGRGNELKKLEQHNGRWVIK